jgi:hypothetical protein
LQHAAPIHDLPACSTCHLPATREASLLRENRATLGTIYSSLSVETHPAPLSFEENCRMQTRLPPKPDFEAIEAAAIDSADRRTMILALIGNLVFSWSNNESMFIYVLMVLLETDEVSAAIVFATLNTTRARLDLVQRLATAKINDREAAKALEKIIARFNESTRIRNEFNHCMYTVNERGEITHTHAMKIKESRGRLTLGDLRPMDDARIAELIKSVADLKTLNRDLWEFLPRLQKAVVPLVGASEAVEALG